MPPCVTTVDVPRAEAARPPAELLSEHAVMIADLIRRIARRSRLAASEHDDFESLAWSHLVKDDYRVLRQYRGDSALSTYLTIVLRRVLLDHRTAKWGKWRPSAEAKRLGPTAITVERLVTRDSRPIEEVLRRLGVEDNAEAQALRQLAGHPTRRVQRRMVGEDVLVEHACAAPGPDATLMADDRRALGRRVQDALAAALGCLTEEDRQLLRSRYESGETVAAVAAQSGLPQKSLYRRFDRLHAMLRSMLEHRGVGLSIVRDVVGLHEDVVSTAL
jgi:RNA polymerase sigma factor (sigma-70 family)